MKLFNRWNAWEDVGIEYIQNDYQWVIIQTRTRKSDNKREIRKIEIMKWGGMLSKENQEAFNKIHNAVEKGPFSKLRSSLIPFLGHDFSIEKLREFINCPELIIKFFGEKLGFLFFFYRYNDALYEVITNEDFTTIYRVSEVFLTRRKDLRK